MSIETRLKELGIVLPAVAMPAANYVPYTISGKQVFVSGTLPVKDGAMTGVGKVGTDMTTEEAAQVARQCGINVLAALQAACGSLDNVKKCVKLGIFVNATAEYTEHPKVANGVSDLMVDVLGKEIGGHARFAVGVSGLPFGVAVEVDGIFEIA